MREISRSKVMGVVMMSWPQAARAPEHSRNSKRCITFSPTVYRSPCRGTDHGTHRQILEAKIGTGRAAAFPDVLTPQIALIQPYVAPMRGPRAVEQPDAPGEAARNLGIEIREHRVLSRNTRPPVLAGDAAGPAGVAEDGVRLPSAHRRVE